MADQDISTTVLKRLVARRKEVGRRLRDRIKIGFGKTQLGTREFQKQVMADKDFRQSMGNQYGPEVLARLMEESNAPANTVKHPVGQPAPDERPTTGSGTQPGLPAGSSGSIQPGSSTSHRLD